MRQNLRFSLFSVHNFFLKRVCCVFNPQCTLTANSEAVCRIYLRLQRLKLVRLGGKNKDVSLIQQYMHYFFALLS